MTCVVGIIEKGRVYIGADSCITDGAMQATVATPDSKVWKLGEFLFGGAGGFREVQVMRHKLAPPPLVEGQEPPQYLTAQFIDAMRATCEQSGVLSNEDGTDSMGAHFLVACRGELYEIGSDFCVSQAQQEFHAIGSGRCFALGALHVLPSSMKPTTRIRKALETACLFDPYCAPPFSIQSVG